MTPAGDPQRRWQHLQEALVRTAAAHTGEQLRIQAHADLSPIGWHLEHCVFVECVWIRSALLADHEIRDRLAPRCRPELAPRSTRGRRLPPRSELLAWSTETMRENQALLHGVRDPDAADPLRKDDRILHFLISHHAQHLETVRTAAGLIGSPAGAPSAPPPPPAESPGPAVVRVAGGSVQVGGADPARAHDNELPRARVRLADFRIARRPVTHREWDEFVAAGGYRDSRWWTPEGWRWRMRSELPGSRPDPSAAAPDPDDCVAGVSRHEAGAYARFRGGRLPHEHEWETARAANRLRGAGRVWEWCANRFHPYPGFRPFPYRGYSLPWFDGRHYVLKGGSRLSEPEVRRAAFRNYYPPAMRHLLCGVRLAFDGSA